MYVNTFNRALIERFNPVLFKFYINFQQLIFLYSGICAAGYEGENCTACEIGKYKAENGTDTECQSCPDDQTTAQNASVSPDQCKYTPFNIEYRNTVLH